MAVDEFLNTYRDAMINRKVVNPLSTRNTSVAKNPKLGISQPDVKQTQAPGFGERVPDWLSSRTSGALDRYMGQKSERTGELASQYTDKAGGQIATDKYGIVQDKSTDFDDVFNKQLGVIGDIGKSALGRVEAKAEWQRQQDLAEMNAGYNVNWTPGASGSNVGAKAVSLAMTAAQKGVPYVWGGNSLTKGVDCSGLVQQVYKSLGINLPRTTYQQAKAGKVVGMGSLLPGDLIFYNTGRNDPNGIGSLSHVAIYIGNGKVVHAARSGQPVKVSSMNSSGTPARAVRPW